MTELERVKQQWENCARCSLCALSHHKPVFSDGPETAEVICVGEGPAVQELRLGKPFVGPAGQLLDQVLDAASIGRANCYLTNAIRGFPPGTERSVRRPTRVELEACRPLLLAEIELIKPKVIIAVGGTAATTLLRKDSDSKDLKIMSIAGKWHWFEGIPVMPIPHPAAILHASRFPEQQQEYKRVTWAAMKLVRDYLQGKIQVPRDANITKQQELFK